MRDYENTAKALRCCRLTSARGCAECPYSVNNNEKCAHLLNDAADAVEELLAAALKIVHCGECKFWDSPPSCEGLAKCVTGETGIRYRSKNDFCSRGANMEVE